MKRQLALGGGVFLVSHFVFAIAFGQSCSTTTNLVGTHSLTSPLGTDGKVHMTYSFVDANGNAITPSAIVGSASASALAQWNSFSSTTLVEFDPLPADHPAASANIPFISTTDANAGACASFTPAIGGVAYGPTFLSIINPVVAAGIFAHELGCSWARRWGSQPDAP